MKKILCAAVLAGLAGAASAQGYVGALAGMSRYGFDCSGATECDKSGSTGKIYAGYSESPNWAFEVGYINFGKASASDGVASGELKSSALLVGGAYRSAVTTDVTTVLRLGIARVKTKVDADVLGFSGSQSDNKVTFYAGLGLEYAVTKSIKVVAGWDFTRFEIADEDGMLHNVGIGAQVGF